MKIKIEVYFIKLYKMDCKRKVINYGNKNYYIYKDGRVLNTDTGKFLKPQRNKGYFTISLYCNGREKMFSVHRLLGIAFIPNPENKPTIDHINRKRRDNRLINLRWATRKEQDENRPKHYNRKPGKSGEKYICITKNCNYEVVIRQYKIFKTFKTMNEAIEYRNGQCEKLDLPTENK